MDTLDKVEAAMGKVAPGIKVVKVVRDVTDEGSVKKLFENIENFNGDGVQFRIHMINVSSCSSLVNFKYINYSCLHNDRDFWVVL
jgi:hypothetical protein